MLKPGMAPRSASASPEGAAGKDRASNARRHRLLPPSRLSTVASGLLAVVEAAPSFPQAERSEGPRGALSSFWLRIGDGGAWASRNVACDMLPLGGKAGSALKGPCVPGSMPADLLTRRDGSGPSGSLRRLAEERNRARCPATKARSSCVRSSALLKSARPSSMFDQKSTARPPWTDCSNEYSLEVRRDSLYSLYTALIPASR